MKAAIYRNETPYVDRLRKFKPKSIGLKQTDVFRQSYRINKNLVLNLEELYDKIGFSEKTVICGSCGHRGTLQKNGEYYQVSHTQVKDKPKTCYFGKEWAWTTETIPVRIIYNAKELMSEE